MIRSFVAVSLLLSASVAVAQSESETGAPVAKPVKEKKICKDSDDSTSRIAKRICKTATEWAESRQKKSGQRSYSAED